MRANDFLIVPIPENGAHLTISIKRLHKFPLVSGPEFHRLISRAPSARKQVLLPRAPRERLDGSLVLSEGVPGSLQVQVPYHQVVVVPTGRQLRAVARPLQAAHLLRVPEQLRDHVVRAAHVVVYYVRVARP